MRVELTERGPVHIVELSGHDIGVEDATQLRDRFARLALEAVPLCVIDLGGLDKLDSALMGELVVCRERVRKRGGVVKLVVTAGPFDTLARAGLDGLFDLFRSRSEALASFDAEDMTAGIP